MSCKNKVSKTSPVKVTCCLFLLSCDTAKSQGRSGSVRTQHAPSLSHGVCLGKQKKKKETFAVVVQLHKLSISVLRGMRPRIKHALLAIVPLIWHQEGGGWQGGGWGWELERKGISNGTWK